MNQDIYDLLRKAHDSLGAAKVLQREGFFDFAISRAYYAMFYAAEALLLLKGLSFSSHSAVVASFGKEYSKTGLVPAQLHRFLIDAGRMRNVGDYDVGPSLSASEATEVIDWTEEFILIARNFASSQ